jgi:hypothetical protein
MPSCVAKKTQAQSSEHPATATHCNLAAAVTSKPDKRERDEKNGNHIIQQQDCDDLTYHHGH